jgi:hypothetical protein
VPVQEVSVGENRAESVADRHRSGLEGLFSSLGGLNQPAKPRPVEKWNPPFCGDLDMRIASDGTWFYLGTPIGRLALVKLFASILRKDPERYVLVTPVERVGITVEDVPFQAVEMAVTARDGHDMLTFRTNVDDVVAAGPEHPLRFEGGVLTGLKPYVHVRGDLWARLTRPLLYDLVERGEERMVDGVRTLGVTSGGLFFPMAPTRDIQDLA